MTSPAGNTPGKALTRNAGVALAICLSAMFALLASPAAAQDRSPSPEGLWKKYPLAPTAEPSPRPEAIATPTAGRRPVAASSDDGAPVIVLVLLGLIGAGGALTVVSVRRRRESEPDAATTPPPPAAVEAPALWHGSSGRFSRAVTRTTSATATVAAPERGGGIPRAAADPPRQQAGKGSGTANDAPRPSAAAARAADRPSPVTPVAAAASTGSPPDRRLAWTAEIEWREIDDESRFYVIARGAGTVVVAQSAPLEWPPSGPEAVKAVRSAADELADVLVAAGWKTLPPGHAWYAKRFAWEPGATPAKSGPTPAKSGSTPAKPGATSAKSGSTPAKRGPKPVAAPSPATASRAPGGAGAAPDRRGMRPPRWKLLALLCVVGVLGLVAALQLVGGSDDPPAGATSAPNAQASDRTDLSVPLLVLLGVPLIVVIVRQTRRARSAGSRKL